MNENKSQGPAKTAKQINKQTKDKNQGSRNEPFLSHKWPRKNFSLQYQYNIKKTSDVN